MIGVGEGAFLALNGFAYAGDFGFQFVNVFTKRLDGHFFQFLRRRFLFLGLQIVGIHCPPSLYCLREYYHSPRKQSSESAP